MNDESVAPPAQDVRVTNVPLPIKGEVQVDNLPPISPLRVNKRYRAPDNLQFTVLELRVGNWVKVRGVPIGGGPEADFLLNLNLVAFLFELA